MQKKCFFCSIQKHGKTNKIAETANFFSRYDGFPVSKGHAEVVPKAHIVSVFGLHGNQIRELYELVERTTKILKARFKPDGFNIGINEGKAAGRTQPHLHVHIIPRFKGDVANPIGGIRNIFPAKADYTIKVKKGVAQ